MNGPPPKPLALGTIVNAMTVDVEDYFQVSAFERQIHRAQWETLPCRVEANVDRILDILAEKQAHATFFTLAWLARRYPRMVRRITDGGHELASHGSAHYRANEQLRDEFLADIRDAKHVLEDIGGREVQGYRAPSFSVGPSNRWAHECMAAVGYRYSSSIYPIVHDHYGDPDAPRFPHEAAPGLLEVPVSTLRMLNRNWPAGGGGFFRLLPYHVSRWTIRRIHAADQRPAMFYFHPWEIDPGQPRVPGISAKARFRHYLNLERTEARLKRLLSDFRWDRVDRVFLGGAS